MTDTRHLRPLSSVEVEERIQLVLERMEEATEEFADLGRQAAESEADFKRTRALGILKVIDDGSKMTVLEREARADLHCADAYRRHLINTAARNSSREHLLSLRAHLDALRSLSASIRGAT